MRKALYDAMLEAATTHGIESDPDHEVGDLQDCLREALQLIPEDSLATLANNSTVKEIIKEPSGGDITVVCQSGCEYGYYENGGKCPDFPDCSD
jgi:hypothetical protein